MTENTYYKPRLVIGDKEVTKNMSGSVTFSGNNQANKCTCKITDPDFQNNRLYGKELKLYLNYGSDDGIPIFRGFIKEIKPNDKETNIEAVDGRMFITGANSKMVELTDDENFDGYSLAGFLHSFIENKINTNNTFIGLDALRDTNPIIPMKGERTSGPTSIYDIIVKNLTKAIDDDDIDKPLSYFIDMFDDGVKNNIIFIKEKQLTEPPSLYLSFSDGIIDYSYKRRVAPTNAIGGGASFTYTSEPNGSVGMTITGEFKDKKTARIQGIKEILLNNRETDAITINSTKGHYTALGSIISIKTPETDIDGNHRLTSKRINFDTSGVKLSLSLNKKPLVLSSYIN